MTENKKCIFDPSKDCTVRTEIQESQNIKGKLDKWLSPKHESFDQSGFIEQMMSQMKSVYSNEWAILPKFCEICLNYDARTIFKQKIISRMRDKLEAVREFVLSRRDDIEKSIENFGTLEPVLEYFLEDDEDARARA